LLGLTRGTLACKKSGMVEKIEMLPISLYGIMGFFTGKFKAFFKFVPFDRNALHAKTKMSNVPSRMKIRHY